jgi:hypothetical protein
MNITAPKAVIRLTSDVDMEFMPFLLFPAVSARRQVSAFLYPNGCLRTGEVAVASPPHRGFAFDKVVLRTGQSRTAPVRLHVRGKEESRMANTIEAEIEQVRAELRNLRDRQDILDCINRYGRGLDRLDPDLIESAYHPDAIDNHGPFVGDVPDFVKFAIEVEGSLAWTHHGISSHNCEIDGDTAHAESYVHWFVRMPPDGKTLGAGGGRYLDKLERRDGQWRIVLRRLLMDWSFEVPYSGWLGPDWDDVRGSRDGQDPSYQRPLRLPDALQAALAQKRKSTK